MSQPSPEPKDESRKPTSEIYPTRKEKIRDFVIGFVGWFVLNGALFYLSSAFLNRLARPYPGAIPLILSAYVLLMNISLLVFSGRSRRLWIVWGVLAAFATAFLITLGLALYILATCSGRYGVELGIAYAGDLF